MNIDVVDVNGIAIKEGDSVLFIVATDELLSGLPSDDQEVIKEQVGRILDVQGFDKYGNVELEFTSNDDEIHFIWVNPSCLKRT